MKKLVLASHNAGKLVEMQEILADLPLQITSAAELGLGEQKCGLSAVRGHAHPALAVAQVDVIEQVEAERAGVEGDGLVVVGHHQGGQRDAAVHADARAACCAANRSLMPFSASTSSASSSSRRNAWPSAVPCSSMKPPPSFITTFMSVSQSLSSA